MTSPATNAEELTVRQVAQRCRVSAHTVRYYDEIGLLKPSARTHAGYRLYGHDELARLREILVWRRLGLPLAEIRELLDAPRERQLGALRHHLDVASRQADRLASVTDGIRAAIAGLELGRGLADEPCFEATGDDPAPFAFLSAKRSPAARRVTDMAGREVELPRRVRRIATNYPALPSLLAMLGGLDTLVASTEEAGTPLLRRLHPQAGGAPAVFQRAFVDNAALIESRPDVILSVDLLLPGLLALTEGLGIPVVAFEVFGGPERIAAGARLLADVLGTPLAGHRAERYEAYVQESRAALTARLGPVRDADRPAVYYAAGAILSTEGAASSVTRWIRASGGANVAADVAPTGAFAFPTVQRDTLLRWDPEVIVATRGVHRELAADAVLRPLAARVHVPPQGLFSWAVRGPESVLMPFWAAARLHPDRIDDAEVRRRAAAFYRRLFGVTLPLEQIVAGP